MADSPEMLTTPEKPPARSLRLMLMMGVAFITATCVMAAVFSIVRYFSGTPGEGLKPIAQRKPALLAMKTLDGKEWSLADYPGKVVVINYFATWCVPCQEEMPVLVDVANNGAATGVVVAAVSLDTDEPPERPRVKVLTAYQAEKHLPFPILLPGLNSPLFATTIPLPQTVLVDRHGRTARVILGEFDPADLRDNIDKLLKE